MGKIKSYLNRLVYNNDPELIRSGAKKNMDKFIMQAMLGTAYGIFSGGVFLSGYLIYLGASNTLVGYATLMPSICGVFMIFFSSWMEKKETRKRFLLLVNTLAKIFQISVIFVPLFVPQAYRIPIVFLFLAAGHILGCINGLAFNTWFTALIPKEIKGRYFSVRQVFCVLISLGLPLLSGWLLDRIPDPYIGFLALFICAVIVGGIELIVFAGIDDVRIPSAKNRISLWQAFSIPLRNKPFMRYTLMVCLFHFLLYLGASFSQTYQIRYLQLSFTYINLFSVISSGLQIFLFYKFWGRVTDRLSSQFTLVASITFYVLDMLLWFFVTDQTVLFLLPLLNIIAAVEGSGFAIGLFNRRYELIPDEGKVVYDAFFACCLGVSLLISPLAGGLLRDAFAHVPAVMAMPFGNFRAVYLLGALTILILQVYNFKTQGQNEDGSLFTKANLHTCLSIFKECLRRR